MQNVPKQAVVDAADEQVEALLRDLEAQMPDLQMRHGNVFALANAWAERYDAILALTPASMRGTVEARLHRIGTRWGMTPGPRITAAFRALEPAPACSEMMHPLAPVASRARAQVETLAAWILRSRKAGT